MLRYRRLWISARAGAAPGDSKRRARIRRYVPTFSMTRTGFPNNVRSSGGTKTVYIDFFLLSFGRGLRSLLLQLCGTGTGASLKCEEFPNYTHPFGKMFPIARVYVTLKTKPLWIWHRESILPRVIAPNCNCLTIRSRCLATNWQTRNGTCISEASRFPVRHRVGRNNHNKVSCFGGLGQSSPRCP